LLAIDLRACLQRSPGNQCRRSEEQNGLQTSSVATSTFAGLSPAMQYRSAPRILFMKQDPRLLLVRYSNRRAPVPESAAPDQPNTSHERLASHAT
jgi:hypothetical protein